jgi:hypothetical protein
MSDIVTYADNKHAYIIGGNLDHPRLGQLFRWGMPQDRERVLARYPGTNYDSRFSDCNVEYFGIGAYPEEISYHEFAEGNFGGCAIQFRVKGDGIKILYAWLCRIQCMKTGAIYDRLWDSVWGWETVIGGYDKATLKLLERCIKFPLRLERGSVLPAFHLLSKPGRPDDSGWVNEDNKLEALNCIIEIGRSIYSAEGSVSKRDVARACAGRYGITSQSVEAGCKAIDRLIRQCNLAWTWRENVLPRIKEINPAD